MNNKHIIVGAVALAMGTAFTSCSHDFDYDSTTQGVVDNYNRIFIETFGAPAANQDWGFGTATKGATRAVFTDKWTNNHSCSWENKLKFTMPADAVDVTSNADKNNKKNFYVPEGYTGKVSNFNIPDGGAFYNYGTITAIEGVNYNGIVTFYNAGTINDFAPSTAGDHIVINIGTLTVTKYSNIGDLYNGGALVLKGNSDKGADIPDDMYIYSNGAATIEMPDGGDMKAVCDIHGTLDVTGDVKIQNSTTKYICGIKATGKAENVDGPLITSYVDANEIEFDGNHIYLLPGGHMKAKTTMKFPNSACNVYGHEGSVALIEATNFEFGNKNDFTHNFSNNIYFKVNGGYIDIEDCYAMGHSHYFATVAEYLAYNGHSASQNDEYGLTKDRVNTGTASGSPACGNAWSIDTPGSNEGGDDDDDDDDNDDDNDDNEVWDEWVRIIVEDLNAKERTDFDFNDVVFDARINSTNTKAQIKLKAAGGTLPLTIGWSGEKGTSYSEFEVHNMYKVATNVMVNTQAKNGVDGKADVIKTLTGTFNTYDDIKVMVQKFGDWIEITANKGEPASKIQVTTDYIWCYEREQISKRYPNFNDYVGEPNKKWY